MVCTKMRMFGERPADIPIDNTSFTQSFVLRIWRYFSECIVTLWNKDPSDIVR